jgi:uncharacterized LabA/DUF88 family protein
VKRLALYIDGFNFYHAVSNLNQPHLKWVDLFKLAQLLARPSETVVAVKYFSAFATWLPDSYRRHRHYVQALQAQGVETIIAHFKKKTIKCNKCKKEWISREEKETDVRLALNFLADAEDDLFDRGMLLTVDSDLVPVVEMVKTGHPSKKITVVAPPKRYQYGRHLQQVAHNYFGVGPDKLEQALLPEVVYSVTDGKNVIRPQEYAPPQQENR